MVFNPTQNNPEGPEKEANASGPNNGDKIEDQQCIMNDSIFLER